MRPISFDGKTLVALSGGADSVALLCLLHDGGSDIEALHCNFHLRGEESERDERFVSDLCKRLNIPLHIQHFETKSYAEAQGISIEMAARQLRYAWFEEERIARKADRIAVAHHLDDQAETVLLNLIRGTGLRGLAGMHRTNGHIVRPLLTYPKSELLQYLQERGQNFVTDSTNEERDALRNRLRLDVIPLLRQLNPKAVQHIAEAASHVAEAMPYYLKGVDASDDISATTLHERLAGCGFTASQEHDILESLGRRSGSVFESPTHRLVCDRGRIVVETKEKNEEPPALISRIVETTDAIAFLRTLPLSPEWAYLDADRVEFPLLLRHPQTGDRFRPYGMKQGNRLVSDFLTDNKLNVFEKQKQWLACSGNQIIWVCGLRIDHRYRVTPETNRILILKLS